MSTITQIPNTNPLNANKFKLSVNKLPGLTFFAKGLELPSLIGSTVDTGNPFKTLHWTGDHANKTNLVVNIFADENMQSYKELYWWWKGIYFPNSWSEYEKLSSFQNGTSGGLYSDATVSIIGSSNKAIMDITFQDLFPVSVGGPRFDYSDVNPISFSVEFAYNSFDFV